ncbi:uncharacterized protein LOC129599656 [Paramacrobiotus metropolitanus]|uniref:uncharacterized protein LOC129599656 n=1 Tax=Paramacrobiotus metropolitanus TaxID=2943436 RepID=UPI002445FDD6|nr:uncharacterized protein LOC129599656 [Paramacrobiotus metropolitanus]
MAYQLSASDREAIAAMLNDPWMDVDDDHANTYRLTTEDQDAINHMLANPNEFNEHDEQTLVTALLHHDEVNQLSPDSLAAALALAHMDDWQYEDPPQAGGSVARGESIPDFTGLFQLVKESERVFKTFNSTEQKYRVEIAPLPRIFQKEETMLIMPEILRVIMDMCFKEFAPTDRVVVALKSDGLERAFYLTMRKLSDFSIPAFLHRIELLNSGQKLVIDDSFTIRIWRSIMPAGGSWFLRHQYVKHDKNRFKTSIVSVRVNNNLCLPAALFLGKFRLTHDLQVPQHKNKWNNYIRSDRTANLEDQAVKIMEECLLPPGRYCDLDDLEVLQKEAFPEFQIKIISANQGDMIIARVPERKTHDMQEIFLLLDNEHFNLVTTATGFYCSPYFCNDCDRPYHHKERHRCGGKCRLCYRAKSNCLVDNPVNCTDCHRRFLNQQCFDIHKRTRKNGKTYCQTMFICQKCGVFVNLSTRGKDAKHQCGEFYCNTCYGYFLQANHCCYIKPLKAPATPWLGDEDMKYIFFDYETYNDPVNGHVPSCIVAQYADGSEVRFPEDGQPMNTEVGDAFGRWLLQEKHRGFTIIAHNFRGYDGHFVLKYMLDNGLKGVEVIKRGTQLLELKYRKLGIQSRDTLNFLALRLSQLPKAVGLELEVQKGDFPHRFNKPENWDKVDLPWPDPDQYMIDGMRKQQKAEFLKWHAEAKAAANGVFNFREQMMTYCSNDVTVLRLCALKFINDYRTLTSLNPMESITMPAACYRYWKTFHLPENKVAALASHGPHRNRRTSIQAAQWLEWENMSANGRIRHGRNGKEVKIGRYFVDGLDEETQTVYEYNGCVFHGHPACTDENDVVPYSKKKMREVYEEYLERERFLESQGYTVEVKWGCEWLREREDPFIAGFLQHTNIREPMNPRDAFKGGRTNASRLFYEVKHGEEIRHFDVVSLYPFVNKTKAYPVGQPEIIISNFKDVKDYFGFVYCKVAAPDECLYPVLPLTINDKLMFVLCKKCAMEKVTSRCVHSDEELSFEGIWCTPELHHAVDVGYRVVEMYEVWHWAQTDTKLFAAYMNKFLKVKMEASGWPAWCDTDEKKANFIQMVKDREGIILDPDAMVFDAGRRSPKSR